MAEKLHRAEHVAEKCGITLREAKRVMREEMEHVIVSRNPDSKKPRIAVTEREIEKWQQGRKRLAQPPPEPVAKPRTVRRKVPFYPDPPGGRIPRKTYDRQNESRPLTTT